MVHYAVYHLALLRTFTPLGINHGLQAYHPTVASAGIDEEDDALRHKCTEAKWFNGTDMEAGLIFKIWHMNLKGTFQYTYWINDNNYTDFLKDNRMRFFVGLGFNW